MSHATDILSLQLIVTVHQSSDVRYACRQLVHKLHSQADHFDWVAIYLKNEGHMEMVANCGEEDLMPSGCHELMLIPLKGTDRSLLGKMIVAAKENLDDSVYSTLRVLARELVSKIEQEPHAGNLT